MSHTYTSLYVHIVFSTKGRLPIIDDALQERLHPYLDGISRQLGAAVQAINGVTDHVHLLVHAPASLPLAEYLQKLKGCSSKWVHDNWPEKRSFAWQRGYGAFSVSRSNVSRVSDYVARQQEHHRKFDFHAEFIGLLRKHGIAFDERYVFG